MRNDSTTKRFQKLVIEGKRASVQLFPSSFRKKSM